MVLAQQSCTEIIPLLDAYFDKELSGSEQDAVQTHLGHCDDCSARLASIGTLVNSLQALPKLQMNRDIAETVPLRSSNVVVMRPRVLAAAGVAAAVALFAFVSFNGSPHTPLVADKGSTTQNHLLAENTATENPQHNLPPVQPPAVLQTPSQSKPDTADSGAPHVKQIATAPRIDKSNTGSAQKISEIGTPVVAQSDSTTLQHNRISGPGSDSIEVAVISDESTLVDALGMSTDEDGLYELKM